MGMTTNLAGLATLSLMLASPALATPLIADFDDFPEPTVAGTISDGGISFSDLDRRLTDSPPPGSFVVEAADAELLGPAFSSPNLLSTSGYVPGPGFGFGRFGSARISFGARPASAASMDIFSFTFGPPNLLTLDALLNDVPVASDAIIPSSNRPGQVILHQTLSVSGIFFDELRLIASGNMELGTVFIGIDNVRIDLVSLPEPGIINLLGLGCVGLLGYQRCSGTRWQSA